MKKTKENMPWVLVNLSEVVYAISCESVVSLNQLEAITLLPDSPTDVRGMMKFRDHIIQLIDIKEILNIKPIEQEIKDFEQLMDARLNDHLNWLKTLEESVYNNSEFTLTTDPHKCAFGKWYDSYNAKKHTNIMFLTIFARFDQPHKVIHGIASRVKEFIDRNNTAAALELIEKTKDTELKQMIHLFDDLKKAFRESKREIAVVLGNEKHNLSIAVDGITAIESLTEIDENLVKETITDTEYLYGLAKRKDGSAVFLLNDEVLLKKFSYKQK